MNNRDFNLLTTVNAEFGTVTAVDGRIEPFIDLDLGYQHAGTRHSVPRLTLSVDQARGLAMVLLAAADKAGGSGTTSATH